MEEKYCERCGLYLGVVRPTRRYCSECKRKVDKERHREREKSGVIFKPKNAFCAYCGKPMLKRVASQKYHSGCAKKAYNAKANLNAKSAYHLQEPQDGSDLLLQDSAVHRIALPAENCLMPMQEQCSVVQ